MDNVATFELIPWILGQCGNISEVRVLLEHMNIWNENFSRELPAMPLHWMVSDREETIVLEAVSDGLKIYDNPVGVLTNNPPFDFQMFHLSNYMNVSAGQAENRFSKKIDLKACSKGMGGLGLPGDLSSASRFVKAAFTRLNSVSGDSESESISQFFHILGSVDQQRGCVRLENQLYEITVYSSCCNTDKGIYYYTTYENRQISGVDMYRENLDGRQLICYPLIQNQQIYMQKLKRQTIGPQEWADGLSFLIFIISFRPNNRYRFFHGQYRWLPEVRRGIDIQENQSPFFHR